MAEIEPGFEEEFKFAEQMKNSYCDESGKETNPRKAAEILHQIELIYKKKSPDKISLIKSVGLLNAAIVRNPSNFSQIESDLSKLRRHILQIAGAKAQNASLINSAKASKVFIISLRNEVEKLLKTIVPQIQITDSRTIVNNLNAEKVKAIQQIKKQ